MADYQEPSTSADETLLFVDDDEISFLEQLAREYESLLNCVSDSDVHEFPYFVDNFGEILRYHQRVRSILNAVTNRPGTNILLSNAGARSRYFDMVTHRVQREILTMLKYDMVDELPRFTYENSNSNFEPLKWKDSDSERGTDTVLTVSNSHQNVENHFFRLRDRNERKLRIAEEWYKWMIEERKVKYIDLNRVDDSLDYNFPLISEMFDYAILEKLPFPYEEESDE